MTDFNRFLLSPIALRKLNIQGPLARLIDPANSGRTHNQSLDGDTPCGLHPRVLRQRHTR
ncbi:putative DNA-binding protein [Streptomyces sp. Tu6071]|nr:putative DNA-binding protein [Streptomyces sp. Tu6071]